MANYKIICGDCLEVMRKMPDKSVDLVLTDPPYGLTDCAWDDSQDWDRIWLELNRIGKRDCAFILFGKQPFCCHVIYSNLKNYKYELIWEKEKGVNYITAKIKPLISHENILVFYRECPSYHPQMEKGKPYSKKQKTCTAGETHGWVPNPTDKISDGWRYPKSVLKFPRDMNRDKTKNHPTQKPVSLLSWLINSYSDKNDTVMDIFCGSASTGIAAINNGRNFIGIEIDPKYCELAEKRIKNECGLLING